VPIVTVSRLYGSGGASLAARVAHTLGWPLLDDLFIEAVAHESGVPAAEVAAREERVPTLVERVLNALAVGSPEALPTLLETAPQLTEERLLAVTRRVIEEAAAAGPAVVVGRGAQCVLAGWPDALHVFCHAPRRALVARAMQRLATDEARAAAMVEETNRQREQYVRAHFGREWRAVSNYHLCVDTETLGVEGGAALVVHAVRLRFGT
jgi:cytidylate kinase